MTAIIRSHLEAVTAEPERPANDPLQAYSTSLITRDEAIRRTGVRDYAELLVSLGDAGLAPPRPPEHQIERMGSTSQRQSEAIGHRRLERNPPATVMREVRIRPPGDRHAQLARA